MTDNTYTLTGDQTVDASADDPADNDYFTLQGDNNHAIGHAGYDQVDIQGSGYSTVEAGAGNDRITDTDGFFNSLNGGLGDDVIIGTQDDFINGGGGKHDVAVLDLHAFPHTYHEDLGPIGTTGTLHLSDGTEVTDVDLLVLTTSAYNDTITASARGDVIVDTGVGDDVITGLGRGDVLMGGAGSDNVSGGDGDDVLFAFAPATYAGYTFTSGTDDGSSEDTLNGGAGNDVLHTSSGADHLDGGAGIDTVVFDAASDATGVHLTLRNGHGSTVPRSGQGKDVLTGIENIYGGSGADVIDAGAGNGLIHGGAGKDRITGGLGADRMDGGAGHGDGAKDVFIYKRVAESTPGARDTILNFEVHRDKVDLSAIDADGDPDNGNQAFHFGKSLLHAGDAKLVNHSGTIFEGDTDGDGQPDIEIYLSHVHAKATDFVH